MLTVYLKPTKAAYLGACLQDQVEATMFKFASTIRLLAASIQNMQLKLILQQMDRRKIRGHGFRNKSKSNVFPNFIHI